MLELFGVPLSQPTRAVAWLLLLKQVPFRFVLTAPARVASAAKAQLLLEDNPTGTIPVLKDEGLALWESHAILTYLATKYAWTDLYPVSPRKRAIVDQYLHFHHAHIRAGCFATMLPYFRPDLQATIPVEVQQWQKACMTDALSIVDTSFVATQPYITGDTLSLADITCYVELAQMSNKYGHVFDFTPYPNVNKWLQRMALVPYEPEAHVVNAIIGDIRSGVQMETIIHANKQASKAWNATSESSS